MRFKSIKSCARVRAKTRQLLIPLISAVASGAVQAYCYVQAGERYGVEPNLLMAMSYQESTFKPWLQSRNSNNTVDLGLMGINTIHLQELGRYGITAEMLLDPCQNVMAGAFLLKKRVNEYGYTWRAVGAYHSRTPDINERYQLAVYTKWIDLVKRAQSTAQRRPASNGGTFPDQFASQR